MLFARQLIEKFMFPSRWIHFSLYVLAIVIASEVSEYILVRNGINGVYPPEADSIGIPLMGMMFQNTGALLVLLFGMSLSRQEEGTWLGCGVIALGSVWSFSQITGWMDPLHYEIGLAQGSLGMLPLIFVALEIRRYRRGVVGKTLPP